jgi:hypothetical protein
MPMKCPVLSTKAIVSDDAELAAALSSALACRGTYLPVLDGPRLTRPDRGSEIIRRVATITHAGTKSTLLAGLSAEARDAIINKLPQNHAEVVGLGDVAALSVDPNRAERPRLVWGRDLKEPSLKSKFPDESKFDSKIKYLTNTGTHSRAFELVWIELECVALPPARGALLPTHHDSDGVVTAR